MQDKVKEGTIELLETQLKDTRREVIENAQLIQELKSQLMETRNEVDAKMQHIQGLKAEVELLEQNILILEEKNCYQRCDMPLLFQVARQNIEHEIGNEKCAETKSL